MVIWALGVLMIVIFIVLRLSLVVIFLGKLCLLGLLLFLLLSETIATYFRTFSRLLLLIDIL